MANALQELVKSRLEQQGWSYGDVARRGGVPRSTVHHLATAERVTRMPQQATLEGLARGLELPLDSVRRAAAEACGIHLYFEETPGTPADPEVATLIASVQQLSPADRRHVTALVESLLRNTRRPDTGADTHTHPGTDTDTHPGAGTGTDTGSGPRTGHDTGTHPGTHQSTDPHPATD
ncbi:helix-turn-helix domain-containing protein [Streptomyces sp. WMMC940]|uniref:helix-turn-helix domain-containing protein n=1 Tax=Streptomyces sp. WMMC940 TaxID=3015153 RepID=UPI0022B6D983|nr:helix-turn-helix transcriptional regulator [Streptomyces sp. WMMC940]MCZ7460086.1 helix-turn-helix transcriptional regulator [Streptomyces sp. WMMC940]